MHSMCMYIYIYTERERETENLINIMLSCVVIVIL